MSYSETTMRHCAGTRLTLNIRCSNAWSDWYSFFRGLQKTVRDEVPVT